MSSSTQFHAKLCRASSVSGHSAESIVGKTKTYEEGVVVM